MRAAVPGQPDDVEQLEAGLLILGPLGQERADLAVEILFEHPRLGDVIVGLAERHGPDDRAAREEADAGHLVQVVVDDEQRHRFPLAGELAQHRQPGGGRRRADDAEVFAEPPTEIVSQRAYHPGVVIDHEQHRS
jgi:hypothetical protein